MVTKLVIWDFNGCLLDDLEHFWKYGVEHVFQAHGLDPPVMEAYRNTPWPNFLEFYRAHGLPVEVTQQLVDQLVDTNYLNYPQWASFFTDAPVVLRAIRMMGLEQLVVSGCSLGAVRQRLEIEGLHELFSEVHGHIHEKAELYKQLIEARGLRAAQVVGVTDTVGDVAAMHEVGIEPFICHRGYHGESRILAELHRFPRMRVIPDLLTFLNALS